MTAGERIRDRRQFRMWSMNKLSRATGVSAKTIKSYEAGRVDPHFLDLVKICKVLNLDIMQLVKDAEKTPTR